MLKQNRKKRLRSKKKLAKQREKVIDNLMINALQKKDEVSLTRVNIVKLFAS
jgi:hypothetical protein